MYRKGFLTLAQLILATRVLSIGEEGEGGGSAAATPPAEPDVLNDIAKFNEGLDTEVDDEPAGKPPVKAEEKPEEKADEKAESEEKPEEKAEEDQPAGDDDKDESEPFKFTENADWETFVAEREQYLESVELSPELQVIREREIAELDAARTAVAEIETLGKRDTVVKLMSALNQMFDVDIVDGAAVPKTEPFVQFLQQNFKKEYSPLVVEMLAAPSVKYRGATMFDEALIDEYGATGEQLKAITDFLESGKDLPAPPPGVRLPASVNEQLKEAWYKLPEIKRFEVEGLTSEIRDLEKELNDPDTSEYDKQQIRETLGNKQARLNVELDLIKDKQAGINNVRTAEQRKAEQDRQAVSEFVGKVVTTYNTDVLSMADAAAADLAPRLSYLDADSQLGEARDKLARVYSALSFKYDEQGNVAEDPLADYYAKQLKEEGIKFDFQNGRQLLKDHFNATWKLEHLRETGGSQQAIDLAESKLRGIVKEIKMNQVELLGQIAEKRVKSSNKALDKKVDEIKEKKQAVRPKITGGEPAANQRGGKDDKKSLDREIAEHNQKVQAQSAYVDDDTLFGRGKKRAA